MPYPAKILNTSFTDVAEECPAGIFLADHSGKCLYTNKAWRQMTGLSTDKAKGFCWLDIIHPDDRKQVFAGWEKFIREDDAWQSEFRITGKTGSIKWVSIIIKHLKNSDNQNAGYMGIFSDITIQKLKITKFQRLQKKLESVNRQLQEVIENERSQIALDLHDDMGQRFTSLKLDLAWLRNRIGVQSKPVKDKLDEMNLLINESIEKIRDFITILKPSVLFELGLIQSIKWLTARFEKESGIKCIFTYYPKEINADEKISLTIYRVMQEALTNILRHSEAGLVMINILIPGNKLEMTISDNGKGMDLKKINRMNSRGISGMRERVKAAGGKISIKSIPGEGTIIKVSFPIK